ncbi:hypothetical protein Fmac_000424 [Flemingia macrophylla]|uniref:RRM domain-containing protein n=1 Tax=Flemingia macrophylla TaxID=520843 RepID=A0ABD1NE95_9FABA
MRVSPFVQKENTKNAPSGDKSKNVYVRNLSYSTTDSEGASRRVGIVKVENVDDAAKAVEALNGKRFDGKEWCVEKANTQSKRLLELKEINDVSNERVEKAHMSTTWSMVTRDEKGSSRGARFVAFSTHRSNSDRKTTFTNWPVPMAPSVAPRMPQYSLGLLQWDNNISTGKHLHPLYINLNIQ